MIVSFRHKALKRLFEADDRSRIPSTMADRIALVLQGLDEAVDVQDLNRPGFRLHALKGDLAGFWSITVSANWRIIFRLEDGRVSDVDFVDYH